MSIQSFEEMLKENISTANLILMLTDELNIHGITSYTDINSEFNCYYNENYSCFLLEEIEKYLTVKTKELKTVRIQVIFNRVLDTNTGYGLKNRTDYYVNNHSELQSLHFLDGKFHVRHKEDERTASQLPVVPDISTMTEEEQFQYSLTALPWLDLDLLKALQKRHKKLIWVDNTSFMTEVQY